MGGCSCGWSFCSYNGHDTCIVYIVCIHIYIYILLMYIYILYISNYKYIISIVIKNEISTPLANWNCTCDLLLDPDAKIDLEASFRATIGLWVKTSRKPGVNWHCTSETLSLAPSAVEYYLPKQGWQTTDIRDKEDWCLPSGDQSCFAGNGESQRNGH